MLYSFHLVASWWCQLWATLHKLPSAELFLPSERQELTAAAPRCSCCACYPRQGSPRPLPARQQRLQESITLIKFTTDVPNKRCKCFPLPLCSKQNAVRPCVGWVLCSSRNAQWPEHGSHLVPEGTKRCIWPPLRVLWLKALALRKIPLHGHCISSWKSWSCQFSTRNIA